MASGTFSFSDSTSSSTQSPTGWDDFQDGSGMGDQWRIEGSGATAGVYRGNPSLVALQYKRNDQNFFRGTFRARGENLEIFPSHLEDRAWRLS